jgi:hypothetical protein
VDHTAPANVDRAPSTSTAITITATTRTAIFLEHHLGAVVGACAGALAEALAEFRNGGLSLGTRARGGDLIAELLKLRLFMIADFPNFDAIARQRGVEAMCGCDVPAATAEALVDEVMTILARVVHNQFN